MGNKNKKWVIKIKILDFLWFSPIRWCLEGDIIFVRGGIFRADFLEGDIPFVKGDIFRWDILEGDILPDNIIFDVLSYI